MFTAKEPATSPFYTSGPFVKDLTFWVYGSLLILAGAYSFAYQGSFFLKFVGYSFLGLLLEILYFLLSEGRLKIKSGGMLITSGLLILSIPTQIPFIPVFFSLLLALFFRMQATPLGLPLNPMLVARLFLMVSFQDAMATWISPSDAIDAHTSATPLDLFGREGVLYNLLDLLKGKISGNWEGFYTLVPGSPGEIFPWLILLLAGILVYKNMLTWRTGVAFLIGFSLTSSILGLPFLFQLFSGSVIFSAVYIAGDPKTTPASISGRYLAGGLAGILNAVFRKYTYYPEGIVFSFLIVNLLSPSLDRMAFWAKGKLLQKRQKK